MKTKSFNIFILYIFLFIFGRQFCLSNLAAQNEKTVFIGGKSGWRLIETRNNITELDSIRETPVLILSSLENTNAKTPGDLSLSFDENITGNFRDSSGLYNVTISGTKALNRYYARTGDGAVLFNGSDSITVRPKLKNAMFSSENRFDDFTIEFWLYPVNTDNGKQIFMWNSVIDKSSIINNSEENPLDKNLAQKIHCYISKNRLFWSFENFFTSINLTYRSSGISSPRKSEQIDAGSFFKNIEFSGVTPLTPKVWSHHLIRFDASCGMLEYIIDGISEVIVYAVNSEKDVYTPLTGRNGYFTLGAGYAGIMDEFKIHNEFTDNYVYDKYPAEGGRVETRIIDLGNNNSGLKVDVSGGKTNINLFSAVNEFQENGKFLFACDTQMNFYLRCGDNPYLLKSQPWLPFTPGSIITEARGRYLQIAADFFPSRDCGTTPYLNELKIRYTPAEAPLPPHNVQAVAADSSVVLHWKRSPSSSVKGYLVYYSKVRGELFGDDALSGASPIDVQNNNQIKIEGLTNNTLYYFRIAAYDDYNIGEFSVEVTARPVKGLSFSEVITINDSRKN